MQKAWDYRQKAVECRTLADAMRRQAASESLLAMARSWDRLADMRDQALEQRAEALEA